MFSLFFKNFEVHVWSVIFFYQYLVIVVILALFG
jgi:hypothetical protein